MLTPQSHPPETSTSTVSPSDDPMSSEDLRLNAIVPLCDEAVTRMWASSTDWVLELLDGRRLSIPLSLLPPPLGEHK